MNLSFVVESFFQKNRIFSTTDPITNRDDCLVPFARLKSALAERGVHLNTCDLQSPNEADGIVFLNAPKHKDATWQKAQKRGVPVHVLAMESEYIHTPNGDRELLDRCTTVFTYRDDWLDGRRYFPVRYSQNLRSPVVLPWADRKFACMLAGNKWSFRPEELYSARLRVIEWYAGHAPACFDLYGPGWNLPTPSSLLRRIARKLPVLGYALAPHVDIWRGQVPSKQTVMSQYRFCYCFENFSGPSGWITEKLFDALFSGAVPVYWGAANVRDLIPAECFIDASKFRDAACLYAYLVSLSDDDCAEIQAAGARYLCSSAAQEFSIDTFVNTLVSRIAV
jgi:hypothetical protein